MVCRRLGHSLKPVVTIGSAGITDALITEFNMSIEHHELMKVKVNASSREERDSIIETICSQTHSTLIQRVGNIALLLKLRPARDSKLLSQI